MADDVPETVKLVIALPAAAGRVLWVTPDSVQVSLAATKTSTVMLPLADNQRATAEALARRGAAIETRTPAEAANAARWLAADPIARAEMARKAAEITDGAGADRIAEAILRRISAQNDGRGETAVA